MNKFKVEVVADNSGRWVGNTLLHDTFDEAKAAALELSYSWTLVQKARVAEVNLVDNYLEQINTTEVYG